jgi:hypothetical protein
VKLGLVAEKMDTYNVEEIGAGGSRHYSVK